MMNKLVFFVFGITIGLFLSLSGTATTAQEIDAEVLANLPIITVDNASSVTEVLSLTGHDGAVNSVTLNPDGSLLASAGDDGTVRLWQLADLNNPIVLSLHEAAAYVVTFNPDGTFLASGGGDFQVWMINVADALSPAIAEMRIQNVAASSVSPGDASTLRNMTGIPLDEPIGFYSVAFHPDGTEIHMSGRPLLSIDAPLDEGYGSQMFIQCDCTERFSLYSPDGALRITGGTEGLEVWDENATRYWTSAALDSYNDENDMIYAAGFNSDRTILASGGTDQLVHLWDMTELNRITEIAALAGHADVVTGVAFSPDGSLLVSSSMDGTVRLWDVESQSELAVFEVIEGGSINTAAFSPDGTLIAAAGSDGVIRLWSAGENAAEEATTAAIHGTVLLNDDLPLVGATVILRDATLAADDPRAELAETQTDDSGSYVFEGLAPGTFSVSVSWSPIRYPSGYSCVLPGIDVIGDWMIFSSTSNSGDHSLHAGLLDDGDIKITGSESPQLELNFDVCR